MTRHVLLALLLLPVLAVPTAAQDDGFAELQKSFPDAVAAHGEPAARVNLVTRVAGYDRPEAARLLVAGLAALADRLEGDLAACEKLRAQYAEVNVAADVRRDDYKTRTELQNKLMEEDKKQRDDSRVLDAFKEAMKKFQDAKSLAALSGEIKKLRSMVGKEVAAEGIGSNAGGAEAAIKIASEKEERVVAAALRGIRGKTTEPVFAFAKASLKSEAWPVRLEAARTLEAMNQPRVLPVLIEALSKEEGRLREDLRDCLRRLTSQNFDTDANEWRQWFLENRAELEGAGPETAIFGAFKARPAQPEKLSVYGIESRSRRILFIIDQSGSMKDPLASKKGTLTGVSADKLEEMDMTKMELAKRELKRAIRAVEPDAWFNIIAFSTNVVRWKEKMVRGDMATKNEAMMFVRDLEPIGGTWTYGAFQEAFQMAGLGAFDKNYDPTVDTIYFISDGAPTDNDMNKPQSQDPEVVLSAVREWNKIGKMAIHAIAIDTKAAGGRFVDFMKHLAAQNNGQYTQRE
jgi:hypothetical protein